MMETWWQDIRYGARMLARSPGFTTVAVLTLALGIGANTAIFSVINAVLLRALPYEEADRLVFLTEWSEQVPEMSFSVANLKDVRDQSTLFESLVGFNGDELHPQQRRARRRSGSSGRQVSSGLFADPAQGARPRPRLHRRRRQAGRGAGGDPGRGLLGAPVRPRPGMVGRHLVLSGEPFTVDRRHAEDRPRELEDASTSTRRSCASRTRSAARRTAATIPASTSSAA